MGEPADVAAGRAVLQVELDLGHPQPRPHGVDRHPRLDPEPRRHGEDRLARGRGERALTGERLADVHPSEPADERARDGLGEPEPASRSACEGRHREVGVRLDERREVAAEVGVAEKDRARAALPLRESQRLPLPAAGQPHDTRARRLGHGGRRVVRAVVGHHDLRLRERGPERRHRVADPRLLVARGDEDGEPLAHSPARGVGGAGSTPSTAPCPSP